MQSFDQMRLALTCLSRIEGRGFTVSPVRDFGAVEGFVDRLGKEYLTPMLSPRFHDFTSNNASWITVEHLGSAVATIGMRYDDLGDERIGSYWLRSLQRMYGKGDQPQLSSVSNVVESCLAGRVVYFGDLYVSQSYRGRGADRPHFDVRDLSVLALMMAAIEWQPDWFYAFVRERDVERGAAYRYGFSRVTPGAQKWFSPKLPRSNTECCIYSSRADVQELAAFEMSKVGHE